jgi:type II secretory pathway pseudopilin PulG
LSGREVSGILKLIRLIKSKRGMTLVEIIGATIILAIVMMAVIFFVSFTSNSTGMAIRNSSVHNELRLMMLSIRNEVIGSTGATIITVGTKPTPNIDQVLFSFDASGERYTISTGMDPVGLDLIREFIPLPHLNVSFQVKPGTHNILVVTLDNADPDPRFRFTLVDEILLPNLSSANEIGFAGGGTSGGSLLINTRLVEAPPI